MDKRITNQNQQQQQQQQVLKCPRCDSSNTKFCYYNNYSLSQPRHFCKACKRYWTRGGTLRNVPVGGGCRKNKRVKKPTTTTSTQATATSAPVVHTPNPNSNPNLDHIPSSTPSNNNSNHHFNPLFYGLVPQNPNYLKFDSRVSDVSGYDILQTRTNSLGLGFSSTSPLVTNHAHSSSSLVSSYASLIGGGPVPSSASAPTMASLLASSLQQQQRSMGFAPFEDGGGSVLKDAQMEGIQNRLDWNTSFPVQNDNDQIKSVESSIPNSLLWNTVDGGHGGWLDPTNNIGSSIHSLI